MAACPPSGARCWSAALRSHEKGGRRLQREGGVTPAFRLIRARRPAATLRPVVSVLDVVLTEKGVKGVAAHSCGGLRGMGNRETLASASHPMDGNAKIRRAVRFSRAGSRAWRSSMKRRC